MTEFRAALALALSVALLLLPARARADPLFGWGQDALEDRFVDGDFDEEDHDAMATFRPRGSGGAGASPADTHGMSWLSVALIGKQLRSGRNDVGGFLVLGLALDRMVVGPAHRLSDPPGPAPAASSSPPTPPPAPPAPQAAPAKAPKLVLGSRLARACVAAALRASGLGADDARVDELVSRARESAWLPETRMRAMRLWTDAAHTTTLAATDTANFYDAVGANLVLELRLTWRLDRLLFAGDEATMERVRLERQDARSRLATRTLELLFAWQRAVLQSAEEMAGSPAELESRLRAAEAQATLDVLTAGWFGAAVAQSSGTLWTAPERARDADAPGHSP
jgi:hypothetical protein